MAIFGHFCAGEAGGRKSPDFRHFSAGAGKVPFLGSFLADWHQVFRQKGFKALLEAPAKPAPATATLFAPFGPKKRCCRAPEITPTPKGIRLQQRFLKAALAQPVAFLTRRPS